MYDPSGREINTLVNENQARGSHTSVFNGNDLPRGTYYYKIVTGNFWGSGSIILQN